MATSWRKIFFPKKFAGVKTMMIVLRVLGTKVLLKRCTTSFCHVGSSYTPQQQQILFLLEKRQVTCTDYLQIAKLIVAGSMETYRLHLTYNINTKKVQDNKYGISDYIQLLIIYEYKYIKSLTSHLCVTQNRAFFGVTLISPFLKKKMLGKNFK